MTSSLVIRKRETSPLTLILGQQGSEKFASEALPRIKGSSIRFMDVCVYVLTLIPIILKSPPRHPPVEFTMFRWFKENVKAMWFLQRDLQVIYS